MSRLSISLIDFCRTGHFGPITLGMTKLEVEQVFGKPPAWGGTFPWWPEELTRKATAFTLPYTVYSIWTYDAMEFHFGMQDRLYIIWCDHFDELVLHGQAFDLQRWIFGPASSVPKNVCIAALKAEGIPYQDKVRSHVGKLELASGVSLSYDDETEHVHGIGKYDDQYIDAP